MARPPTELVMLEAYQRQMFILVKILKWTIPEVADFFDRLFEEMSIVTGPRHRVP